MKPWSEVEASPEFQALSVQDQSRAQSEYFDDVVAPQVEPQDLEFAREEFFTQFNRPYLPAGTAQGSGEAAFNQGLRSLAKVGTGTVEGLAQLGDLGARILTPESWEPTVTAPFKWTAGAMESAQQNVEEALPINPLLQDTMGVKAAGVGGQVAGQLGSLYTGSWISKAPRVLQALGLGQAGLLGLESGYEEADRLGVTGWQRDALATSYAAAEAGVEGMAGFGAPSFTKALIGEIRETLAPALVRGAKTALGEGLEEPVTGTLQAGASNVFAEEDPNRPGYTLTGQPLPSINPTESEFWNARAEEFALGTLGGTMFAGAQFLGSRPQKEKAQKLYDRAAATIEILESNPQRTPEEELDLADLRVKHATLGAALQTAESPPLEGQPAAEMIAPATAQVADIAVEMPENADEDTAATASVVQAPVTSEEEPPTLETTEDEPQTEAFIETPATAAVATQSTDREEPGGIPELEQPGGFTAPAEQVESEAPAVIQPAEAQIEEAWLASTEFTQAEELAAAGDIEAAEALETAFRENQASARPAAENALERTETAITEAPVAREAPVPAPARTVAPPSAPEGLDPYWADLGRSQARTENDVRLELKETPAEDRTVLQGILGTADNRPQTLAKALKALQPRTGGKGPSIYQKEARERAARRDAVDEQLDREEGIVRSRRRSMRSMRVLYSGVTRNAAETAKAALSQLLPTANDAWIGTSKEVKNAPGLRQAFIQVTRLRDPGMSLEDASERFDQFADSLPDSLMEGFTVGGRQYVLIDGVGVTEEDGTPERAVRRVMIHEDSHEAVEAAIDSDRALKEEWEGIKRDISAEDLDSLAASRYPWMSNWRNDADVFNDLAHEWVSEQMEMLEKRGEPPQGLLKRIMDFFRKVLAKFMGEPETSISDQRVMDFIEAGRAARARGYRLANPVRPSQQSLYPEDFVVPDMPEGSADLITHQSPYPGMTSQKIADYAWPRFYAAWNSNRQDPDSVPTEAEMRQLEAEWKANLADENAMEIAADNAFSEERMTRMSMDVTDTGPFSTPPETGGIRFSMRERDPLERLKEINDAFSYATQAGQQQGLDPTKATQDQRTFASGGARVDFSRQGMTGTQKDALTAETIDLLSDLSPDGKSKTFGKALMAYLSGKTQTIYGQQLSDLQQTSILNHLDFAVQERASMGIDGAEVQRVRSQRLSQAGAILQTAASSIYEPLRDIANTAKELTDKSLKEEGMDPVKMDAEIKADVQAIQTEIAKDISTPENKALILEGAQNEADELYELGLSGLDPKFVAMIRERDERIVRIGQLRKLEAMLSSGPKGVKASMAALPANMTLEEVRAMIAKEEAEVQRLTSNIEAASKKEKRKAKQAKAKDTEDNATFTAWVMGGESAGIDSFDDLMLKYIDPNGFDRDAFTSLLTNSFKQADPNLIAGVVNRVADMLDGAATEEGITEDGPKSPNYDARVKRLVATEIAKGSTSEVMQAVQNPLSELTKQRLKGEISAENFPKELVKLGIEQESAYAYLQKVDQDRARIGDAKAQRELNAQAKKDMAAFRRASEKSDRETQSQINALAKQFSDTPNLSKAQATSDLKLATNSFLGKEGPPITEEEFLSRLEKLNVTDQNAQKLLKLLQESRRRDSAVRYAKSLQKAQEARKKAIESAVKKLEKKGTKSQAKLRQRSTFVNSVLGLLEGGIMDSETIRQAFAQAYDLHGLTPEVLKDLGTRLQQILAMKEGMVKETMLNEFNSVLNEVAPKSTFVGHAHSALMGYVLGGLNTMLMQITGVNRFINPLANTVEILMSGPGTTVEKLGRTMNPKNFFRLYAQGMREVAENLPQVQAGISGMINSRGLGVGAMPSSLAAVKPREQSLSWTPWGQLSKYRFQTPKMLEQMGLGKFIQATRYPGWMVSRSFQAIRAAEGIVGNADKNLQWRAQMTTALMQQDPKLSWADAYDKVADALGDKTTEMWKEAYQQADQEIADGTVAKLSRKQRATELVQDKIEEKWALDLKNRPRELAALYGYKQDPITPAGAWVYNGLSRFLNQNKGAMQYAKFSFLFARFFANAIETAYTRTPLGGLAALALPTEKAEGTLNEREQRIEQIYGTLGAYRDARIARSISGTAFMGAVAGLMILALKDWDPDDDEPPFFWITGDPIGEFSKKGTMEAGGWWKANTMYLGPVRINYVNASPEFATVMGAMGAMGDRFLFDKLLNYRENKETGEYERSNYEAYGKPVLEALAAPISRSTYRQWYDAVESAYAGDFKKMTRIVTNPAVGTAVALSPLGMVPSIKTFEKVDRSSEQPRTPRSALQAAMASVPFASELGLDAGKPLTTPFGNPLTPYPFWSIFSNTQEVPPEVGKAAKTLASLGVARLGPAEEYFGWGMAEIAHDGKKYLLNDAQRARVLASIGSRFARLINQNAAKLRKIEASADGRDKVRQEISKYAKQARNEALAAYQRLGR